MRGIFGNVCINVFPQNAQYKKSRQKYKGGVKFLTACNLPFVTSVTAFFIGRLFSFVAALCEKL